MSILTRIYPFKQSAHWLRDSAVYGVGENSRVDDVEVNVCKKKHVTNMRASGSDEALRLVPHVVLSLEQCIEFIADDELLEVTPKHLRLRKKILDKTLRAKARSKN